MKKNKFILQILILSMILVLTFSVSAVWSSNLNNGLNAYYTFEENGINYQSSVSPYNNGTANSGVTRVAGKVGYGASCDGITGLILMNDSNGVFDSQANVGNFTISYWEYRSDTTWIMSRDTNTFPPYMMGADAGGYEGLYESDNFGSFGVIAQLTPDASLNVWRQIVIKQNETGLYTYTDGNLISSQEPFITASDSGEPLRVCNGQNIYFSNSIIDELGFWNRSLSDTEISQLYNGGTGITYESEENETISPTFNVTLSSPTDSLTSTSTDVEFNCNMEDSPNMLNLTLIIDGVSVFTVTNSTANQTDLSLTQTLSFADNSSHTWTCQGFSSTFSNTATTQTFSIAVPLTPPSSSSLITGSGDIFDILNSSGAGLGIFIQFLGQALPVLLIMLALVGVITIIGYALVSGIKRYLR
jgi:hypothetical protein